MWASATFAAVSDVHDVIDAAVAEPRPVGDNTLPTLSSNHALERHPVQHFHFVVAERLVQHNMQPIQPCNHAVLQLAVSLWPMHAH